MLQPGCLHTSRVKSAWRPEDGTCQDVQTLGAGGTTGRWRGHVGVAGLEPWSGCYFHVALSASVGLACLESVALWFSGGPGSCPLTSSHYFNRNYDHFYLFAHFARPLLSHPSSLSLWPCLELQPQDWGQPAILGDALETDMSLIGLSTMPWKGKYSLWQPWKERSVVVSRRRGWFGLPWTAVFVTSECGMFVLNKYWPGQFTCERGSLGTVSLEGDAHRFDRVEQIRASRAPSHPGGNPNCVHEKMWLGFSCHRYF